MSYYSENRVKILEKAKTRYWSDGRVRQRAQAYSRSSNEMRAKYLKRYGLTLDDYHRMHDAQDGLCAICSTRVEGERMCVDHDHGTGQVRGLLCRQCNSALGIFRDSQELLLKAADYLKRHS